MKNYDKPMVVVSRCLGFDACRYNGQTLPDKFVTKLKDYVEFITVCPEVEIGLGVPRAPIRLVREKDELLLYQPESGKVYTKEMMDYATTCFDKLKGVDGFILKGRSPSCGIKDVKIYLGKEKGSGTAKGIGIFASKVMENYTCLAIEEEGRLSNFRIREHFLTKLYTMFRFREVEKTNLMSALVAFQADNKYLLMAYNQKEQKILGRIVANHENRPINVIMNEYKEHLGASFARLPRYTNYINSLMHIFGYFSENLSANEKSFILETFNKYKQGFMPLSVPINLLESYAIKYDQEYLLKQTIWAPFPGALMDISDTGKPADLLK